MSFLFDKSFDALSKSLDMRLLRHEVIAGNIANAETPGFKAKRVEFESELQRAVDADEIGVESEREISLMRPRIEDDVQSEMGQDLNTVDMDREMAAMTKNDIQYSASTQAVSKKFALLKYAITEGGER